LADLLRSNQPPAIEDLYLDAVAKSLRGTIEDPALLALSLQLPPETTLAQEMDTVDPDALHHARLLIKRTLAEKNRERFLAIYQANQENSSYEITPAAIGRRNLKNVALAYLMTLEPLPQEMEKLCFAQYKQATNMTDTIAALSNLVNFDNPLKEDAFVDFYKKWRNDPLVLDKWFSLQATSRLENTLDNVIQLTNNKSFSMSNPNKVRALIGAFCTGNHVRFHDKSGVGYRFLGDKIEVLNSINPQIAARLVVPLINWRRYDAGRQQAMQQVLERILAIKDLSRDVYEIASKSR